MGGEFRVGGKVLVDDGRERPVGQVVGLADSTTFQVAFEYPTVVKVFTYSASELKPFEDEALLCR